MPIWSGDNARGVRRETILKEAARCFSRKGYHGTTIGDIAQRVNVSKAALYYYVKNKEEILFKCHEMALDIGMEGLRRAEEDGGSPDRMLKIVLRHYIEGVADQLQGSVVLLEDGMLTPRHHREAVRRRDEFEGRVRSLVEKGIAAGLFARRDAKMAVFAMLGAANWIPKWYTPTGERTAKEIGEIFADYLVDGLRQGADGRG